MISASAAAGARTGRGGRSAGEFVFKMLNFVFKMLSFVSEMMDHVFKMMNFVFKNGENQRDHNWPAGPASRKRYVRVRPLSASYIHAGD